MRILVLSDEVWNDKINGNNVTTSWFEGMNADFANIYTSPGMPDNPCCKTYFQVTDMMMLRSIFTKQKAGKVLEDSEGVAGVSAEQEPKHLYRMLKKISGSWLRTMREILWSLGQYNQEELKRFLENFQPDVIFSERRATCKMLRLETVVQKLCQAPMFAFTGDDEYSLKQFSVSSFFWMNRFAVRKRLRQNVRQYEIYYTLSLEQKLYYERIFGCRCKVLHKCGTHKGAYREHTVHHPIKLIYAGKLYCNRWRILAKIAQALREINADEVKMVLEIYTKDAVTLKQSRLLNDGRNSVIKGAVSQEELRCVYQEADIALHVESDDIKNRLATRLSFSTKIVDCLFSGCAVLACCWDQHSGFTYLQRENAAICFTPKTDLKKLLQMICKDPQIICDYSEKAYLCAEKKHLQQNIQNMLLDDFRASCCR